MMSNTDSTTDDDCRFESPWFATALTRSFLVTVGVHLPCRTRPGRCTRRRPSLSGPRDERRVAALLELAKRGRGGRPIVERADPYTVERVAARCDARVRRRARGRATGPPHLHLEPVDRQILR